MTDLTKEQKHDAEYVAAEPFSNDIIEIDAEEDLTMITPLPEEGLHSIANRRNLVRFVFIPFIFLTAALLGGLRINAVDGSFLFLRPSLMHLIFAAALFLLFVRGGMIRPDGWFSEHFSLVKNAANGTTLLALYAASVQMFNSLIPEQGLPFWVISFCFLWTLWNNLFAGFDAKRLVRSLGGLFAIAFVSKYILLVNLTAPTDQSWVRSMIENPAQSTLTWLLDLPRFAPATGYIQFFAVALFFAGLYMTPSATNSSDNNG